MYTANYQPKSNFDVNEGYEAESIEEKVRRATATNEPIEAISPMIFTERKDGVLPQYDIRTDRFEVALDAKDRVDAANAAMRDNKPTDKPTDNVA